MGTFGKDYVWLYSRIVMPKHRVIYLYYAVYSRAENDPCFDNFRIFIKRAVRESSAIKYNFLVIGDTVIPSDLVARMKLMSNVNIHYVPNLGVDLCSFSNMLKHYHKHQSSLFTENSYFFFLNCGTRGPYFSNIRGEGHIWSPEHWMSPFFDRLKGDVAIVGPTISCEIHPHVQTYAALMNSESARVAMELWDCTPGRTKLDIIKSSEVGLSEKLIAGGHNIASVALYHDLDFRLSENKFCGLETDIGKYFNPFVCYNETEVNRVINSTRFTYNCLHLDPCDTIFIKFGGEGFKDRLLSQETELRIHQLDKRWDKYLNMAVESKSPSENFQICRN